MRLIAILGNVGLLGITAYQLNLHGFPQGLDFWFMIFLIVAPATSLFVLFRTGDSKNWLSLFLKRKALEEQKKIEDLRGQK